MGLPLWFWKLLQYFMLPVGIGILLAYEYQHRLLYRLAEKAGMSLAHHLPAAWDYTFEALPAGAFILVTLADGRTIPGKMTKNSFASSSNEDGIYCLRNSGISTTSASGRGLIHLEVFLSAGKT